MQPYGKRGSQTVRASDSKSDEGARGCLVASGRERQMSWQCIALASCLNPIRTQSHPPANPCPPRNGPRPRPICVVHAMRQQQDGCQLTHKGPIRRRARHLHASQRLPFASQPSSISQQAPAVAPKRVRPTASRIAIRALPCLLASLLFLSRSSSVSVSDFWPPRAPRSRQTRPSANGPGSSSSVMRRVA